MISDGGYGATLIAGAALAGAGVVLLVASVVTARGSGTPVPDLDGYFDRWRDVHGGYDPRTGSVWVRAWLIVVYRIARPLAVRGVRPDVLTLWTAELACAALLAASSGGPWLLVAAWLVLLCGLGDSLDGGVAVLGGTATRWGYVLDSVVDRVTDVLVVSAVVVAGAPPALGVACGVLIFLLEYLRARGANAGAGEVGMVTVGERPNRLAIPAAALHAAGVLHAVADVAATAGLAVLTGLTLVGLVQLAVAVRRQLSAPS